MRVRAPDRSISNYSCLMCIDCMADEEDCSGRKGTYIQHYGLANGVLALSLPVCPTNNWINICCWSPAQGLQFNQNQRLPNQTRALGDFLHFHIAIPCFTCSVLKYCYYLDRSLMRASLSGISGSVLFPPGSLTVLFVLPFLVICPEPRFVREGRIEIEKNKIKTMWLSQKTVPVSGSETKEALDSYTHEPR